MRIAFYAPMKPPCHPVPSGDRQMARLLIAAMAGAGHRVEVASTFRSYDGRGDARRQRRIAVLGGRIAARAVRRYHGRPASASPDLWFTYHLYHKAPDWLGPAVCRALGVPYVVAEASLAAKRADGAWGPGHAAAADAIRAADLIVTLNSADRPGVAAAKPTGRTCWLAPFIDARPFLRAAEARADHRRALTRPLGIADGMPILAVVAMMRTGDKLASYRRLAATLAMLCDRPWTLLIAGDGPARADVRAAFAPFGDRVRWLGMVAGEDLPRLNAAADVCLWPAVNEAYGLALLEAQAAGTPVVAGRCGGVADIVGDGETGLLSPVGDDAALAGSLSRLLDDDGLRRRMEAQATQRVRRRHDLPVASSALDALLEDCARWVAPRRRAAGGSP